MRILIVEDDAVLADALSNTLRSFGYVTDALATGAQGDLVLTTEEFDLVILDIELPGLGGFELLSRLRARKQTVPVLILTARDTVHDRIRGLDMGADDYLAKPFEMDELVARIRALLRRARGRAENIIDLGQLVIDLKGRIATLNGFPVAFAARELAALEVLALRAGRVVSKEALKTSLYDWDNDVGPNAIEIVVHRIRRKLQGSDISIRTIRGLGYFLDTGKRPGRSAQDVR